MSNESTYESLDQYLLGIIKQQGFSEITPQAFELIKDVIKCRATINVKDMSRAIYGNATYGNGKDTLSSQVTQHFINKNTNLVKNPLFPESLDGLPLPK